MSLAKSYCKEIIRELDKIPVYIPGTPVNLGDIITFGSGLFAPRPIGSFTKVTSLSALGIPFNEENEDDADTYRYASKGSVGVSFVLDADAAGTGKGTLDISFSKAGATYFVGADCRVKSIVDLDKIEADLDAHKSKVDWKNCFIVTSITLANRALIMQSNTTQASLSLKGEVQNFLPGTDQNINASGKLTVNSYKDASFIKEWSDNVAVFFDLAKYKKRSNGSGRFESKSRAYMFKPTDSFILDRVDPQDLLMDEELIPQMDLVGSIR